MRLVVVTVSLFMATSSELFLHAGQEPKTFRTSVEVVEVDVRVTNKDGEPVRGLAPDDFVVLENGVRKPLASFTFVDLNGAEPVAAQEPIASDLATNAGTGRMWVMLLGGFGRQARLEARRFVEALGPSDEVAVVIAHGTMSSAQGFTRNKALLLNAIERLGESPANIGLNADSIGYRVLEDLCNRLGRFSGHKAVVYFDPPAYFQPPPNASPDQLAPYMDQLEAVRAAARNNVAIYVVSTAGLTTELGGPFTNPALQSPLQKIGGQRLLAEETGGDAIVNSNNYMSGYQRFLKESSAYYLLSYVSTDTGTASYRSITVRVAALGATVRARRGYYAAAVRPTTAESSKAFPSASIVRALQLPVSHGGIRMEVFAAPFRGTSGDQADVLVGARLNGRELLLEEGAQLEIGALSTNAAGRVTPGVARLVDLKFSSEARAAIESSGLGLSQHLTLPKGRHQIRLAVHQPNGNTGMVVTDVEVPDFTAEALSLSGLVLTSALTADDPAIPATNGAKPLLPVRPNAIRQFGHEDTVVIYFEVYTSGRANLDALSVTAALQPSEESKALEVPVTRSSLGPKSLACLARLPLRDLQAGRYVVSLEARAGRRTASRRVGFVVTP